MVFRQFYRKKGFSIYTTVSIEIWFVRFVNFVICLSPPLHANWGNSVASIFSWHIHAMSVNAHSIYLSARPMELFFFYIFSLFCSRKTQLGWTSHRPFRLLLCLSFRRPFFSRAPQLHFHLRPPPSVPERSAKEPG